MFLELPYISFFTSQNAATFFQNVRAVMFVVMPILMIYVATQLGGHLISMIHRVFSSAKGGKERYEIKIKDKD